MRSTDTTIYKYDAFLEMRRNFDAYSIFFSKFVPCIVGKRRFRSLLKVITDEDEIATPSDEALALLTLENSGCRWDKIFENSEGKIRKFSKNETIPPDWMVDVPPPEYTKTSKDDPDSERNTEEKAWSNAGIIRFNQLRHEVIEDRKLYPNFKIDWLKQVRAAKSGTRQAHNVVDSDECPDADDDLFSDTKVAAVETKAKNTTGVDSDTEEEHEDEENDDNDNE